MTPEDKKEVLRVLGILKEDRSREANRAIWHIMTALRGPDNDDEVLKSLTTSRIRGLVFSKGDMLWDNGAMYIRRPLTGVEMKSRDRILKKHNTHLVSHYYNAVVAIEDTFQYDLLKECSIIEKGKGGGEGGKQ